MHANVNVCICKQVIVFLKCSLKEAEGSHCDWAKPPEATVFQIQIGQRQTRVPWSTYYRPDALFAIQWRAPVQLSGIKTHKKTYEKLNQNFWAINFF